MNKEASFRSNCPISCALDLVGDKWSLLILRDMLFFNKTTFKELSSSPEGIASNILANRLSKLEKIGIISKSAHPTNKKTRLYSLNDSGWELLPSLLELFSWFSAQSSEYGRPVSEIESQILAEYKSDKDAFIKQFRSRREAEVA